MYSDATNDTYWNSVLPEKPTSYWIQKNDYEQYQLFITLAKETQKLRILLEHSKSREKELEVENEKLIHSLHKSTKYIKKNQPSSFGGSIGAGFIFDQTINIDAYLTINFYFLFLKYFIISPGITVQLYRNIGGGFNFNFGFLL